MPDIEIADRIEGEFDAAIIMECSDLSRTGVEGLDRFFLINIDHHPGNKGYGDIRWFDDSAAACGEMVFALIRALDVPLSVEIATHIYLAILTDTGSFHYSSISPQTFDICRQAVEAGVDPVLVARSVYDSNNMGRLKLFGSVLRAMQLDPSGRIAIVYLDHEMAREAGGTYEDTEGLVNLPLTVKEIQAVVFFKQLEGEEYRVSLRSKGDVDIGSVAKEFGGGGHKNAAGCTATGPIDSLQKLFVAEDREGALRQDAASPNSVDSAFRKSWTVSWSSTSPSGRPRTTSWRASAGSSASSGSAIPARSIRAQAACCRSSSGAPRGSRGS